MYGSGPLDDNDDMPPTIPSFEEFKKEKDTSEKNRRNILRERKRIEKAKKYEKSVYDKLNRGAKSLKNLKRSFGRGMDKMGSLFSRNKRSSRPRTELRDLPAGNGPRSAVVLPEGPGSGYVPVLAAGGRKRINRTTRKPKKRTIRKPKKRSKRTRRLKR